MKAEDFQAFEALPLSTTCRRIDFDKAEVVPGIVPKTFFLIVNGTKPWVTMEVQLIPLIYIDRPDYWGIELVGCQSGVELPTTAPFTAVLEITHYLGKKGIEVIGAARTQKFNVP